MALSKAANQYREHVKKVISGQMAQVSVFPAEDPEIVYGVELVCHFEALENPGWFEFFSKDAFYSKDTKDGSHKKGDLKARKGDRKAKSRYKKIDVDNRVKFVQDCVTKGLGIPDDAQIFEGTQRKIKARNGEKITVTIYVADRSKFFADEE